MRRVQSATSASPPGPGSGPPGPKRSERKSGERIRSSTTRAGNSRRLSVSRFSARLAAGRRNSGPPEPSQYGMALSSNTSAMAPRYGSSVRATTPMSAKAGGCARSRRERISLATVHTSSREPEALKTRKGSLGASRADGVC